MKLWVCSPTIHYWQYRGQSTYLVEEPSGELVFKNCTTGQPVTHEDPTQELSQEYKRSSLLSYCLPPDEWPPWADPDLEVDEGL